MSPPDDIADDELERQVHGAIGTALAPQPMPPGVQSRLRSRIAALATTPPEGTATWRVGDDGWSGRTPGVAMKLLRRDTVAGTQEMLLRLGAGVQVPAHSHTKEEQMVILEGELRVGEHLLRQGDVHVAPPGSWHPMITVERGCLLLLRSEFPLPAG